jgi:uncharacterized protein YndB with AHSA1/START domain
MTAYRFSMVWKLEAPIEQVWEALRDWENWPTWWRSLKEVKTLKLGNADGVGQVERQSWATPLPIPVTLACQITQIEPPVFYKFKAKGFGSVIGQWHLASTEWGTAVQYILEVNTNPLIHQLLTASQSFLEGVFYPIMEEGGRGLAQFLQVSFRGMERGESGARYFPKSDA